MKISVIVPTYNRPKALKLCLLSLARQSVLPDEVLIADDGSGPETRDIVLDMQKKLNHYFLVKHVWQEDVGFRKPRIINETVRQSSGDYLVFIDGDCMAHRHFISSHVEMSDINTVLSGKRVEIGKNLTEKLLSQGRVLNYISLELVLDALMKGSRKVEEGIRIKNRAIRRLCHRDVITDDGVWGCNFSLYRDLFIGVNGCDEDFLDGSIEDNDIGIRAINQGKNIRTVRALAIIFHLWHVSSWGFQNSKYQYNLMVLKRRIANKETFCKNGFVKL